MWKLVAHVGALGAALAALGTGGAAQAATLKAEYQLQGTLASQVAGAPDLADLGAGNHFATETLGGASRQVLVFPRGGGVSLAAGSLVDATSHSVVMVFRLANASGFRRLVDFSGGTSDDGLYVFNGKVGIWVGGLADAGFPDGSFTPRVAPGAYVEVTLTSEVTLLGTQWTVAYADGVPVVATTTSAGFALTSGAVRLFRDNIAGPARGEQSAGALACLVFYDGALTSAEVRQEATDATHCPVVGSHAVPHLPYALGNYVGVTSQGLPIAFGVEPGQVRDVTFAWRARCADGHIHTNSIGLGDGVLRYGRFSLRGILNTGARAEVAGRIRGSAASGTLSRWGNSAFGTSCPDRGVRWRARLVGGG